jgi:hypothetical protein
MIVRELFVGQRTVDIHAQQHDDGELVGGQLQKRGKVTYFNSEDSLSLQSDLLYLF